MKFLLQNTLYSTSLINIFLYKLIEILYDWLVAQIDKTKTNIRHQMLMTS